MYSTCTPWSWRSLAHQSSYPSCPSPAARNTGGFRNPTSRSPRNRRGSSDRSTCCSRSHTGGRSRSAGCPARDSANPPSACPTDPSACRRCGLCFLPLFLCFSRGFFSPLLQFEFPSLRFLLLPSCFVLHVGDILRGTMPIGVQNQPLVMLRLGEDPSPGIEEYGGRVDRSGHRLVVRKQTPRV